MNIIGITLIIMFLIFSILLCICIAKICVVLKTLKTIQSGVAVSSRGVGDLVNGELKNFKLKGFDIVKSIVKGKLK